MSKTEWPSHFVIGDSAATMRLLCGVAIRDACWTNNPYRVTCRRCEWILDHHKVG